MSNMAQNYGIKTALSTVYTPLPAIRRGRYSNRMDLAAVISRIEARARAKGLSEAALSKSAGSADMIRNWRRAVAENRPTSPRHDSLQAIARALDVDIAWLLGGNTPPAQATGFQEMATPFRFAESPARSDTPYPALSAVLGPAVGTIATYRLQVALPAFALAPGDLLIVDMSRLPLLGEVAIVSEFDDETASAMTTVRRYLPPFLIGGEAGLATQVARIDENRVTVRHPVVGSLRGTPT